MNYSVHWVIRWQNKPPIPLILVNDCKFSSEQDVNFFFRSYPVYSYSVINYVQVNRAYTLNAVKCNLMELTTLKRVCVLWGSAKLLCARTQQCFVRHLGQCICQGSAFPCVLLCLFVHLHQCILWACIGKPVQSAVFCCPHERGSLCFMVVPFCPQA